MAALGGNMVKPAVPSSPRPASADPVMNQPETPSSPMPASSVTSISSAPNAMRKACRRNSFRKGHSSRIDHLQPAAADLDPALRPADSGRAVGGDQHRPPIRQPVKGGQYKPLV